MGWTLGLTRRALEGCGAVPVTLADGPGWLAADDDPVDEAEPWVALLPSLDPATMGWKQRSWYLPDAAAEAFDSVGNGGPTIWVDGRIVGAWAQDKQGEVHLHYFEQVAAVRRREVDARVADLKAMVGDTRFAVRFPGNIHKSVVTRCSLRAEDSIFPPRSRRKACRSLVGPDRVGAPFTAARDGLARYRSLRSCAESSVV